MVIIREATSSKAVIDVDTASSKRKTPKAGLVAVKEDGDDDADDDPDVDDTDYEDIVDGSDDDKATLKRKKQKRRRLSKWTFKRKESIKQVGICEVPEATISYQLTHLANINGLQLVVPRSKKSRNKKDSSVIGKGGNDDLHTDIKMFV